MIEENKNVQMIVRRDEEGDSFDHLQEPNNVEKDQVATKPMMRNRQYFRKKMKAQRDSFIYSEEYKKRMAFIREKDMEKRKKMRFKTSQAKATLRSAVFLSIGPKSGSMSMSLKERM